MARLSNGSYLKQNGAWWDCYDCRNTFEITLRETDSQSPRIVAFCPVCGAQALGSDPSFYPHLEDR